MPLTPNDTLLNKYRIVRLLGEGGMAQVWLAEELNFGGRQVALKEPRPNPLSDDAAEITLRYRREVQVCAALEQAGVPQIVRAITAEPYEDGLLLVMTYMPGGDLADLIRQHPAGLAPERAAAIALDVLAALAGAHNHPLEIVHRDVKPSNILFNSQGRAYLADFGLAQLAGMSGRSQLRAGQHPGTPAYMAPEQESSAGYLTPAADLFALGCILWEMLTGKRYKRFKPGTPPSHVRADLPAWLDQVVAKAMAEDPWERWQSAEVMVEALQNATLVLVAQTTDAPVVNLPPRRPARVVEPSQIPKPPIWQQIGIEMVRIPAGEFLMGSDPAKDELAWVVEKPQHTVYLPEYWIARTPVTNAQYAAFVKTTRRTPPPHWPDGSTPPGKENHPAVNINWNDAQTFCQWAKLRLPTEQEWEKATRGTDGRLYPWGDSGPNSTRCNFNQNVGGTTPVSKYPAGVSPYGLLDMAGNVSEWCADWYRGDQSTRVMRGGSWNNSRPFVRAASRLNFTSPDDRFDYLGFRPARSP